MKNPKRTCMAVEPHLFERVGGESQREKIALAVSTQLRFLTTECHYLGILKSKADGGKNIYLDPKTEELLDRSSDLTGLSHAQLVRACLFLQWLNKEESVGESYHIAKNQQISQSGLLRNWPDDPREACRKL